jgi:hypothetical protein
MGLYRIYIDEVGNHDLVHAEDPNQRFLSLTSVVLESQYALHTLRPEPEQRKREFFQVDADEPVIFHRKNMVNKRGSFSQMVMLPRHIDRDPRMSINERWKCLQVMQDWYPTHPEQRRAIRMIKWRWW